MSARKVRVTLRNPALKTEKRLGKLWRLTKFRRITTFTGALPRVIKQVNETLGRGDPPGTRKL